MRDHPPRTIGATHEVEGQHVQVDTARRRHALHAAQVAGMAQHQGRWQQRLLEQALLAIGVRQDAVEQARALRHAALDATPFLRTNDVRQHLQRPGSAGPALGLVDVVGDAVFADLPSDQVLAALKVVQRRPQVLGEVLPQGPQGAVFVTQLVEMARLDRAGAVQQRLGHVGPQAGIVEKRQVGCHGPDIVSTAMGLAQVQRERMLQPDGKRSHIHRAWRVAHAEEARQAAALCLIGIDGEGVVAAATGCARRGTGSRPASA